MAIIIDLNKDYELPQDRNQKIDVKYNNKFIIRNSILERIDSFSVDELRFVLENFKDYISDVVTSQYYPSFETMKVLEEMAPNFKVKFKTGKDGGREIIPITVQEFFDGYVIFEEIITSIDPNWSNLEKFMYIYYRTGEILSYDLDASNFDVIREDYARNIFTAVVRNISICQTFAAVYDYLCFRAGLESEIISEEDHDYVVVTAGGQDFLTDITFDSTRIKFGLSPKNFCVSREQFQKNRHDLDSTEASDYVISYLDEEDILRLSIKCGLLIEFDNKYTDNEVLTISDDLNGDDNFTKMECFIKRLSSIKTVGRPTVSDYFKLVELILKNSKDIEFSRSISLTTFMDERDIDSSRKLLMTMRDKCNPNIKKSFIVNGFNDIGEELDESSLKKAI